MGDKVQGDYEGLRPFFTDWKGEQPYNVVVNGADGSSADAGSYDVNIQDYWNPLVANSTYHYGDFTPAAGASGLDLGGFGDLSGASVYNITLHPGTAEAVQSLNIDYSDGATYSVLKTSLSTNTVAVTADGKSADFVQLGGSEPMQLWNSLDDSSFPQVPAYVVPSDAWAALDFDPGQFLGGGIADGV